VIRTSLRREATLSAAAAAATAAALAWLGPPGSDLAAHAYQRALFLQHGFELWNNFWYAGRYSFVSYSLLYYPLAALLGIRLLAVATVATAAYAFAVVLWREWGPITRWSSRTFAVVWAGIVLSAAFPFALGAALALLALWALQSRAHWRFALLALLTLAASPVALVLLAIVAAGLALARGSFSRHVLPAAALAGACLTEVVLWRAFPAGGRDPFSLPEAAAGVLFCGLGLAFTWRVETLRILRSVFGVYLAACVAAYLLPLGLGENVARLRFAALPLAVLVFSVRRWRPLFPALVACALAVSWNVSSLAASYRNGEADPSSRAAYWSGAIGFLRTHLTPDFRVEAVDTVGHWPAVYLAGAGIPIARGWFRQDDFPENATLYSPLGRGAYLAWLRELGVRYVVLTDAPPDYSSVGESDLIRGGHSGLRPVWSSATTTVYAVATPRPILTGPDHGAPAGRVVSLGAARLEVALRRPGYYRLAVRWSPYWRSPSGCLARGPDGMIRLSAARAGDVRLVIDVDGFRALEAVAGRNARRTCARSGS
jgi:hypothetical protein